jgi:hypothetical protein
LFNQNSYLDFGEIAMIRPIVSASSFRSARPILFRTGNLDYPYSACGSGFVVRYGGRVFVITSRHAGANFDLADTRVQYHPNAPEFIVTSHWHVFHGGDPSDTDQYDIVVHEADGAQFKASLFRDYPPYSLPDLVMPCAFGETSVFATQGYPTHLRKLEGDIKSEAIISSAMLMDADYAGRCSTAQMHKLRVHCASQIQSFDGMSGAPVFQVLPDHTHDGKVRFAGMLLRGTSSSGEVQFLGHERIINALSRIVNGEAIPACTSALPNQ